VRLLRLKTVLAATDLEPSSDAAVENAIRLADAAGAKLHVVYVSPDRPRKVDSGISNAESAMTAFRERVGWSANSGRVHVKSGDPASTLSRLSDEISADVIVMGRHRQRAGRQSEDSIGSTAYDVVTRTLVPCLITSRSFQIPIEGALVAIDTSETARGALLVALSWSSALRQSNQQPTTTLTALHIESGEPLSSRGAERKRIVDHELDVLKRGAESWAGVSVTVATRKSKDPVKGIIGYVNDEEPDLVVLGTRGLSARKASGLGSVSSAVTNGLDVAVLLVPPAVWRKHAHEIDYV
jgi:universal stress protein E